jgi:hypothetical protein
VVVEPDPGEPAHEVYKLRFAQDLPDALANLTSDAVHTGDRRHYADLESENL